MKIAITGHTSGIGKGLYDRLAVEHNLIGLSRSNGYNICDQQEKILEKIHDCDVFINNAQDKNCQTSLFNKVYNLWKNDFKTILNIGSLARYQINDVRKSVYAQEKINLNNQANYKVMSGRKSCRIITVNPGYVDTKVVNENNTQNCLKVEEVCDVVEYILKLPHHIEVLEINLHRTYT